MDESVSRKVQFFDVIAWDLDADQQWRRVDLRPVFQHIASLTFEDGGRYSKRPDGDQVSMPMVVFGNDYIEGKIGRCRLHNLPYKEHIGEESPLELEENTSLFEPSHYVLFEGRVLGIEYNHAGIRPSGFRDYVVDKVRHLVDRLEVRPIFRRDVAQALRSLGEVRLVDLAVRTQGIQQLASLSTSLHEVFEASTHVAQHDVVEIVMRVKGRRKWLGNLGFLGRLAGWLRHPENQEVVDKLQVRGLNTVTDRMATFDLLEEKIMSTKQVVLEEPKYRHVVSDSMLRAIRDAYYELRSDIWAVLGEPE